MLKLFPPFLKTYFFTFTKRKTFQKALVILLKWPHLKEFPFDIFFSSAFYSRMATQRTPSTGDITDDDLDEEEYQSAWGADVIHLPPSLEVEIRVHKGTEPLGKQIFFSAFLGGCKLIIEKRFYCFLFFQV